MKLCGIYIIENIKINKVYIGQSTDINRRFTNHRYELKNHVHCNKYLQSSWNEHGENSFAFKILCVCSIDELNEKEKYFIKKYNSYKKGFNNTEGGQDLEILKNNGYKLAKFIKQKRKNSTNSCLECGEKTQSGYRRYCEKHRHKCLKCGKRFGLQKSRSICSNCINKKTIIKCSKCQKPVIKTNNRQKYCKECRIEINKIKARLRMKDYRLKHNSC